MATKEDILEQLVEEYLTHKGYFVRHNIKYLPCKDHPDYVTNQDSNHSDIDVLGYNPTFEGYDRVWAVSCKSWQGGFNPAAELRYIREDKKISGRKAWKRFRELIKPKWSEAFIEAIKSATKSERFTYVLVVAWLKGNKEIWEKEPKFLEALNGNPIRIITFQEMVDDIIPTISTTLAATEVGRMLQMFKVSGILSFAE